MNGSNHIPLPVAEGHGVEVLRGRVCPRVEIELADALSLLVRGGVHRAVAVQASAVLAEALKVLLLLQDGVPAFRLLRGQAVVAAELHLIGLRLVLGGSVGVRVIRLTTVIVSIAFDGRAGASSRAAIQAGEILLVLLGRMVHPRGAGGAVLLRGALLPVLLRGDLIQD